MVNYNILDRLLEKIKEIIIGFKKFDDTKQIENR